MTAPYEFTGPGNCRSCDAAILWFRTPAGKNMPVDDVRGVLPDRAPLSRGDTVPAEEAKEGILPFCHFSSCPSAAGHRRRG